MKKKFLNYEEQIELLKTKGLYINDEQYAKDILKNISYFALINGYKEIFKSTKEYKQGVDFRDIVNLYNFDSELRAIILRYILIIERKIKAVISYEFCEKYGYEMEEYLNVNNYDNITSNQEDINTLVNTLKTKIKSNNYKYLKHYNERYENVPLWVLVNTLTFGNISNIFKLSKQSLRQKISKELNFEKSSDLIKILKVLTKFRNVCAHNERLYDFKTKDALAKMEIHNTLNISKKGSNDIFAIIICFKLLLSENEFNIFVKDILGILEEFRLYTNVVNKKVIFSKMGLPNNWKEMIL